MNCPQKVRPKLTKRGQFLKAKYSKEFKMKVVKEYLESKNSYKSLLE